MPAPATIDDFLDLARKSNQVDMERLGAYVAARRQSGALPAEPRRLAALLIREGLLTQFQAEQLLLGKYKGFHLGGYRIIERIGAGGAGMVYLAEHQLMRRRAAIKVLPTVLAEDPGTVERFRREATAAAVLDHPNIVHVFDFRQEGPLYFLVMEYVDGASLQEIIARHGALPVHRACDCARQAALGLQCAHEHGMVHRDIKPANLMLDRAGGVKILDFGLARVEEDDGLTRRFNSKSIMGTADYLSPEQALNLHEVDIRADIYSLGATLYTLLAGRPPFHFAHTVTQKLMAHQLKDAPPVDTLRPDLPAGLVALVSRLMARKPDDRPSTPAEVARALEPWCRRQPRPAGPAPAAHPAPRPAALPASANDPETVAVLRKDDTASLGPLKAPAPQEGSRRAAGVQRAVGALVARSAAPASADTQS